MKKLQFKCRLLSEVILNQKAATEGNQETLDFIPGGVFLGIAASTYNEYSPEEQALLFHSGKVRFGDAHPMVHGQDIRSLHVPAVLFYPKLKGIASDCYLHHFYKRQDPPFDKPLQLKQCRQGYYTFEGTHLSESSIDKTFAIKSAYNRTLRRSDDSKMYGYEALEKGTEFLFTVECDEENLADKIVQSLCGVKHIGRSRTAQYGLAEISVCSFRETVPSPSTFTLEGKTCITVYADGRLIFLDDEGAPTFTPSAKDLGLEGEILWEKSQVRTFQYAPWNGKRQTRDTDRVGFEKGSTFVVSLSGHTLPFLLPTYVGSYKNEGFGKVVYGWDLLQNAASSGRVELTLTKGESPKTARVQSPVTVSPLISYLERKKKAKDADEYIYREVNKFYTANSKKFPQKLFASQWGGIRSIVAQHTSYKEIMQELFDKTETKKRIPSPTDPRTEVLEPTAYLTHGIASDKWKEKHRISILREFVELMGNHREYGDLAQKALINLSSVMAKK